MKMKNENRESYENLKLTCWHSMIIASPTSDTPIQVRANSWRRRDFSLAESGLGSYCLLYLKVVLNMFESIYIWANGLRMTAVRGMENCMYLML